MRGSDRSGTVFFNLLEDERGRMLSAMANPGAFSRAGIPGFFRLQVFRPPGPGSTLGRSLLVDGAAALAVVAGAMLGLSRRREVAAI